MKNKKKHRGNPALSIIAGAYLLYLTFQLVRDLTSGVVPDTRFLFISIAAVIFGICGVFLLFSGSKSYYARREEDSDYKSDEIQNDEVHEIQDDNSGK